MAGLQNAAAWLPGVGKQIELGSADIPEPGPGELLIEVRDTAEEADSSSLLHAELLSS